MTKNTFLHTALEITLIVAISAAFGIFWNRSTLTDAWRGHRTEQGTPAAMAAAPGSPVATGSATSTRSPAATGSATATPAAPAAEALPMPVGLPQVKELHDAGQAVLVDARSATSYAREHISGAVSFPLEVASRQQPTALRGVAKDAVIIAYCNGFSCHDSMELGKLLMKAGYGSVYVFEGGLPEWRDAGYPTAGGAR